VPKRNRTAVDPSGEERFFGGTNQLNVSIIALSLGECGGGYVYA